MGGTRYLVQREDAVNSEDGPTETADVGPDAASTGYDPARAMQILDESVGTWSNEYVDELIEELYQARLTGSRA